MPNELVDNGRGTMTFQQAIISWALIVLRHEETTVQDAMSALLCIIARAGDFYALRAFLDSYWRKLMPHSENIRLTRNTAQERGLREPIKGVVQYIMNGMTPSRTAAGES